MHRKFLLCICTIGLAWSAGSVNAETLTLSYSDLRADENLVFFRTSAWMNDDGTA